MQSFFENPQNLYEKAMNEVYAEADSCIGNRTYAGIEPVAAHLVNIYNELSEDQREKLWESFYTIFTLTDVEEDE